MRLGSRASLRGAGPRPPDHPDQPEGFLLMISALEDRKMSLEAPAPSGTDHDQRQLRIDLAAAFRLAAEFNWHESVGNHFSVTVTPGSAIFLMNPRWMHFSRIRASDLLLLDGESPDAMNGASAPDPS